MGVSGPGAVMTAGGRRSSRRVRRRRWGRRRSGPAGRAAAGPRTGSASGRAVEGVGHEVREALGLPHPAQTGLRVAVQQLGGARLVVQWVRARARVTTSLTARLSPLAPVGGTMCAASPARNSRPWRIGSWTKLRIGVTDLAVIGPRSSVQSPSTREAGGQLVPDPLVGPVGRVGAVRHLEVEPGDRAGSACCAGRSRAGGGRRSTRRRTAAHRPARRARSRGRCARRCGRGRRGPRARATPWKPSQPAT